MRELLSWTGEWTDISECLRACVVHRIEIFKIPNILFLSGQKFFWPYFFYFKLQKTGILVKEERIGYK